ncbi:MAG TPA: hypothetical protein VG826_12180 [Pirellulales bacterium]|nr:hypothetical protein [Pirellulales bacterium]
MSNAWFFYVSPLAISSGFVIASVVLFRKCIREKPHGQAAGCFGIVAFGVGCALGLAILFSSPTPWQRQRIFDHTFRTPPERIQRFIIRPDHGNQAVRLTEWPVMIDDPTEIRRIAAILRNSREMSLNHPHAKWTVTVEEVTIEGTYYFKVYATVPGDLNGTFVTVQTTKEGGGWNLGHLRSDGLDQVLEDAVNAARQDGVKPPEH